MPTKRAGCVAREILSVCSEMFVVFVHGLPIFYRTQDLRIPSETAQTLPSAFMLLVGSNEYGRMIPFYRI